MLPTLAVQGDYLLTEKTCLWRRFSPLPPLRRGDLVVYTSPVNPKLDVCKRVLGLAGDVVCIDPSGLSGEEARYERVRVPKGHLWVQGDNLDSSNDSRLYGPVPLGLVKGRVVARVSRRPSLILPQLRPLSAQVLPFSRRTLFDPSSAFRLSS